MTRNGRLRCGGTTSNLRDEVGGQKRRETEEIRF
jgi:hypothetical protein